MHYLTRIFVILLIGLSLSGCFKAEFLDNVPKVEFSTQPMRLKNITAQYVDKPDFKEEQPFLANGVITPIGNNRYVFLSGENPDPTKVPDKYYLLWFYELAEAQHLMAYVEMTKKDDGKHTPALMTGVAFVDTFQGQVVVTPWADKDFLNRAISGQIEADNRPPSENPFADIGKEIVQVAPMKSQSDVNNGITTLKSMDEVKRISAAIKAEGYVSNRTLFFELRPF